jgi:hypothetical protein
MASHTKIEPVERAHTKAASGAAGASSRVIDSDRQGSEPQAPASSVSSSAAGQNPPADDEDVSLDELMMSDALDGDDASDDPLDDPGAAAAALAVSNAGANESSEPASYGESDPSPAPDDFGTDPLDDEAASLAAAAAAQEVAAQVAEAEALAAAAQRASESSSNAQRAETRSRSSSAPPPPIPDAAAAVAARVAEEPPASVAGAWDFEPPRSTLPGLEPNRGGEPAVSADLDPIGVDVEGLTPDSPQAAAPSVPVTLTPASPAARLDGPLPSFDIPAESARAGRNAAVITDDQSSSRVSTRPPAPALSHLSEASEEDDDDAVTHIGLPVVPEASDYPELGQGRFQVADQGMAALRGYEPAVSHEDARRATTRVVQRIDTTQLEERRLTRDTNPALSKVRPAAGGVGMWLSGLVQRVRSLRPQHDELARPGRRAGWLLDTVLPPLSLVLFGSGIGAGIMLLQPDRGAKAAQQAQSIQALREAPAGKRPTTLAERAEAGDGDALFKITNMSPSDRTSGLTLALERGQQAQKQNEFKEFARLLDAPGGLQAANLTTRFLSYATAPETMLPAFAHLLAWPGNVGPDVLYAVWEKAPGGNRAASLAQQLLHSADQRAKATPALITALDLRSATSCEDYLRVLPSVKRDGDQRCSATLRALKHTDGCGDDGQQDCFACLRDGKLLDDALVAIEGRVAPQL